MRQGYQQGDVLLTKTDLPKGAKAVSPKARGVVVAEGEVTGHAHVLDPRTVTEYELGGIRFLVIDEPSDMTHEEHASVTIAPGTYQIGGVVEKDWLDEVIRPVGD